MAELIEREVILVITEIAGYTNFMLQGARSLAHAEMNITCLLEAVLSEAKLPLVVVKMEGDSVFMYADCRSGTVWQSDRDLLRRRLARFSEQFHRRLAILRATNTCDCGACSFLDQLAIAIVVHAGRAVVHRFNGVDVLAGSDVRRAQGLVQNFPIEGSYLLATAAAFEQLAMDDGPGAFTLMVGQQDGFGAVTVLVERQVGPRGSIAAPGLPVKTRFAARPIGSLLRLWAAFRSSGRVFTRLPMLYSVPGRYQ